jgi:hypothetical protein
MENPDFDKDESYIRRRNFLLERMKKTRWDEEESKPQAKRGRKPSPPPKAQIDPNKPRNKFFKFN